MLSILNEKKGYGFIFDGINAVWYACEGDCVIATFTQATIAGSENTKAIFIFQIRIKML